jgi:peptidoglycan hydrolase-like protein with peptidoglycan-binding domain
MIKLRSLLSEQQAPKLRVLFVGDHQTKANWSYANQLINSGFVNGKIVGWTNASTAQLYRILKVNLSKRYDVISIMGGDVDGKGDAAMAISNLEKCYTLAKKYNAKVVAISNPTKIYLDPQDKYYDDSMYINNDVIAQWVTSQTKTDVAINTLSFGKNAFTKNNYILNSTANQVIAEQWKADVLKLGLKPKSVKSDGKVLKLGSSGPEVKELHDKLNGLGFNILPNEISSSVYGQSTYDSVLKFQDTSGLNKTGNVDSKTYNLIDTKSKNKPAPKSTSDIEDTPEAGTTDTSLTSLLDTGTIAAANYSDPVEKQSAALVSKFEGFISTPRWDVNNWRVGFGSSTVTDQSGVVSKLPADRSNKPNITVSKDDALRDLTRRLETEFIPKVMAHASGLSDGTIAALVSVAYNYGSLPNNVVTAMKTKNTDKIAQSVLQLSTHNGGINARRREKEAAYILNSN